MNKLQRSPKLQQLYGEIIKKQEQRVFIEKVNDDDGDAGDNVHYLPHYPVKKDSVTELFMTAAIGEVTIRQV